MRIFFPGVKERKKKKRGPGRIKRGMKYRKNIFNKGGLTVPKFKRELGRAVLIRTVGESQLAVPKTKPYRGSSSPQVGIKPAT